MLDETEMASGPADQRAADNLPGTHLDDQITLLKNGYEPIPIKRGTKYPEYTWTSDHNVQITEQWLCDLRSDRPDHTSTGLRTGHLVGLDIDISDDGHARIILEDTQQQLGASYFHRIGSKGVLVCYQNETPIKKITIKGRARSAKGKIETLVEVLGEGQQFVGYGWHPKGMKYHWPFDHLGCDPLATPLNKLPAVTPAQIRKSVESICQKLRDLGYHDVHATESGVEFEGAHWEAVKSGAPVTAQMLQAMLTHIDPDSPRDDWRNVAAALKSACIVTENGELEEQFDGLGLFDEWSAAGRKYRGYADCLKLWNSLKSRNEKKGSSVGLGTLIFLARRGGYDGPTKHSSPTKCWGQNLGPNDQTILERINAR